jgi:hypothetical protein
VNLRWGSGLPDGPFTYERDIVADCTQGSTQYQTEAKLNNLGYGPGLSVEDAVKCFQADYAVDNNPGPAGLPGGVLPPATRAKLEQIYEDCDARGSTSS